MSELWSLGIGVCKIVGVKYKLSVFQNVTLIHGQFGMNIL